MCAHVYVFTCTWHALLSAAGEDVRVTPLGFSTSPTITWPMLNGALCGHNSIMYPNNASIINTCACFGWPSNNNNNNMDNSRNNMWICVAAGICIDEWYDIYAKVFVQCPPSAGCTHSMSIPNSVSEWGLAVAAGLDRLDLVNRCPVPVLPWPLPFAQAQINVWRRWWRRGRRRRRRQQRRRNFRNQWPWLSLYNNYSQLLIWLPVDPFLCLTMQSHKIAFNFCFSTHSCWLSLRAV